MNEILIPLFGLVAGTTLFSQLVPHTKTPLTYYVSPDGSNNNSGTSVSAPFKTIQKAADLTKPGDTVLIMNGTYTSTNPGQVVLINRSGTARAWIKYKAYPGHKPKIKHASSGTWHGIFIGPTASYIEIEGLEVEGNNQSINLNYAMKQKNNTRNPLTSGNCISIDGRKSKGERPHHIKIVGNKTHNCGGGGISVIQADYVTVDKNQVFNNAWYSVYGNSGISLYQNWNYDNKQDGYRMVVTNNKVYRNRQYIPWIVTGTILDGNGIIIDDSKNTQNGSKLGKYVGRTLVANNVTYKNGGSGIHSYLSQNIDIINNTAYLNNQAPELSEGQIFANSSDNIRIFNNILYSMPGKKINSNSRSTNVMSAYNIFFGSNKIGIKGLMDVVANPKFVNAAAGDFRLVAGSPAINKGTNYRMIKNDIRGRSRLRGGRKDIGAYEY